MKYLAFWTGSNTTSLGALALAELSTPANIYSVEQVSIDDHTYRHSLDYYTANGLFRGTHRGRTYFSHGGEQPSYVASLGFTRQKSPIVGLFVATNGPGGPIADAAIFFAEQALLELLFTGRRSEWNKEKLCVAMPIALLTPRPLDVNAERTSIERPERFEGLYSFPLVGTVQILRDFQRAGNLLARMATADLLLMRRNELEFDVAVLGERGFVDRALGYAPWQAGHARWARFERGEGERMSAVRFNFILRSTKDMDAQPVFVRVG